MNKNILTRKEQGNKTKEKIFKTSVRLISEKGYDNVSVNEICETSGVAKGTFYVHYKSKEDIVRESYYQDMGKYVIEKFNKYVEVNANSSIKEKIIKFLLLEFEFTEYIGYEMTCLAYVTNLSECVPGPCRHFERREFTNTLKQLLKEADERGLILNGLLYDEAFLFLETSIRGMMATWCFSNGNFNIVETGNKYVQNLIKNIVE